MSVAYEGASKDAIQHHYDLSNDFFALWLDAPTRTYSCALWDETGDDTLEAAQARKLDWCATSAGAPGAQRVLDVGCGWGGLVNRLVEHHGVQQAVGLTLSDAQAESIAPWAGERIEVRVENWIEHQPERPYDAIVSVGAFEHFADYGMTRDARLKAYRAFFERCHAWLPPRGRLVLQTNVKGNAVRMDREMLRDFRFVIDRIFPESELPWTSEILEASERRFDPVTLRNDPDHYARTCDEWLARLRAAREQAERLVGPENVADYERYLGGAAEAFRRRHLGLVRIVFERA